jgi:hypothetical protein
LQENATLAIRTMNMIFFIIVGLIPLIMFRLM